MSHQYPEFAAVTVFVAALPCDQTKGAGVQQLNEPCRRLLSQPPFIGTARAADFWGINIGNAYSDALHPQSVAVYDAVSSRFPSASGKRWRLGIRRKAADQHGPAKARADSGSNPHLNNAELRSHCITTGDRYKAGVYSLRKVLSKKGGADLRLEGIGGIGIREQAS